jgi:hypothetical protein
MNALNGKAAGLVYRGARDCFALLLKRSDLTMSQKRLLMPFMTILTSWIVLRCRSFLARKEGLR